MERLLAVLPELHGLKTVEIRNNDGGCQTVVSEITRGRRAVLIFELEILIIVRTVRTCVGGWEWRTDLSRT